VKEDFNNLNGWLVYQGGQSINPAGQLQLQAPSTGADPRSALTSEGALLGTTNDYTLTIYMKVDDWSSSGHMSFQLYSSHLFTAFDVLKSGIQAYKGSVVPYTNNNDWHTYTIVCKSGSTWDIYVETQKLNTWSASASGSFSQRLSLDAYSGILLHIDWITVIGEAKPPTGGGGTTTASLNVDAAWYDGSTKMALSDVTGFSVGGVQKTVPATWSSLTKGSVQLVAPTSFTRGSDTYTFLKWSDESTAASRSYDLQSDSSLTSIYGKNGGDDDGDGGGGGGGDIIANIMNFIKGILNNPQVQQIELIAGGLTTLICGVMFILPTKRYGQPAPAQPRYY
jgi:hypothetical protein